MKRLFDIVFSIIMFIILFPINLITSIIIFVFSGRPVFFFQKRMGRFHKPFTVYKFRTMVVNAEDKHKDGIDLDDLVTREGKILRKLHFDEFSQLINVIKGDMSIVGPRPLSIDDYHRLFDRTQEYKILDDYRPGITGLASIYNYAGDGLRNKMLKSLDIDKIEMHSEHFTRHVQLADYYHEYSSFWLDLRILYWTGLLVLSKIFGR